MSLPPRSLASASLLLLGLCGCLAPEPEPQGEPYTPPPEPETTTIGYFLTTLDNQLKAWTNLKLAPSSSKDLRALRGLERELTQTTAKRQEELLAELDSQSPRNRAVAAVALGFTADPAVAAPLLNALSDPDPLVVNNALVGLGVLASPETPLARICFALQNHTDPWTRNNAAFAITSIVSAGGRDECILAACRNALIDPEPGVRAQAASVLGMLADSASVQPLGDLLFDEQSLVVRASAAALASIGRVALESKGRAARILVDAAARADAPTHDVILAELGRMSAEDYGNDLQLWTEWAYRLP